MAQQMWMKLRGFLYLPHLVWLNRTRVCFAPRCSSSRQAWMQQLYFCAHQKQTKQAYSRLGTLSNVLWSGAFMVRTWSNLNLIQLVCWWYLQRMSVSQFIKINARLLLKRLTICLHCLRCINTLFSGHNGASFLKCRVYLKSVNPNNDDQGYNQPT